MKENVKEDNDKEIKKCRSDDDHLFIKVENSAMKELWDEEKKCWYGAGFKTWICRFCKKKVKSS
jgi:hypothetical protein